MFLPCSHHNLHLYPWPINSNSQTLYFHHCLEWAVYKFRNLPPSLLTFPRRPSSLSQAVSLLNLIVCCQWENSCLNISISLGCLSLSNFESKQVNAPTPPCKKKNHIDSIDRWLSALQFTAQSFWPLFPHRAGVMFAYQEIIWLARHKLTGFAWLCYYIDFSLFVGVGTIFLMVAPFLPLGQLPPAKECAIISTVVPNPAKTPAPSATAARSVVGITPSTKPGW